MTVPDPNLTSPGDVEDDSDEYVVDESALDDSDADLHDCEDLELDDVDEPELPAAPDDPKDAKDAPKHPVARENWNVINAQPHGFPWFSA